VAIEHLGIFFSPFFEKKNNNNFFRGIFERIGYIAELGNLVEIHCNFFHFGGKIVIWMKLWESKV
jgi:hypothetical protein